MDSHESLVGGFKFQPIWKNIRVNMVSSSPNTGDNKVSLNKAET